MLSWNSPNQYSANILSKPWLHSHITIVETTDSGERGMNPVAMIIVSPQKEYWLSGGSKQQPPFLKSAMLPTELWVLAHYCCIKLFITLQLAYTQFLFDDNLRDLISRKTPGWNTVENWQCNVVILVLSLSNN